MLLRLKMGSSMMEPARRDCRTVARFSRCTTNALITDNHSRRYLFRYEIFADRFSIMHLYCQKSAKLNKNLIVSPSTSIPGSTPIRHSRQDRPLRRRAASNSPKREKQSEFATRTKHLFYARSKLRRENAHRDLRDSTKGRDS